MFNNHQMSVVHDLSIIGPQINNIDFIAVAAITTSDYPKLQNIYNASILIPPTDMLMKWADGNDLILQFKYPKYLSSQIPDEMIISLLALLTKKNVILYIPKDEYDVFGRVLLGHLYYVYGIVCNSPVSVFSADETKIPIIISKFYMLDIMSANDYLSAYPPKALLPEFVINKLVGDLHPFNRPATYEEYLDYFNKLNASKGVTVLHPSMVKVVDKNGNIS